MPVVDAAWEDWLATNAKRGCTVDSMVEAMVGAGFDSLSASAAVQRALGAGLGGARTAEAEGGTQARLVKAAPADYQYDASPVPGGNLIRAFDRDVKVLMRCERPQVIVFGDVLSPDECAEMIERSRSRGRDSQPHQRGHLVSARGRCVHRTYRPADRQPDELAGRER
jgi:prolyl 4-hydroxylase